MKDILLLLDANGFVCKKENGKYIDINKNIVPFHETHKSFMSLTDLTKTIFVMINQEYLKIGRHTLTIENDKLVFETKSRGDIIINTEYYTKKLYEMFLELHK